MMQIGDVFPHFVLADENGETVDSAGLTGLRYVVFFYAKDRTTGCTKEAQDFTALYPKFMLRNIPLFGISGDSPASHQKFIAAAGLKVKLLADPDHLFAKKCGAFGLKMMYGKQVEGTIRSTFLVGRDGRIEEIWTKVKVDGHAQKVLDAALSHFRHEQVPE
ncbi:MAG: peroxiredoxin [Candidatus Methanomethylophilus sp.]|jgi:peroxiredoxin Q/BCP|nr:peroxiredoxin [Methanomethylophilus sp.]MDD4222172.1 peroxiredoxin [Methanomethylophilus sp.]MDD4668331.1 peroxiredoxin [Methanomethylophilus sp.]